MSSWLIAALVFFGLILVALLVFFALTIKDLWAGRTRNRHSAKL